MIKEFEGKTEQEAIDSALDTLGLDQDQIKIEVIEEGKARFFFGKKKVKIRVHYDAYIENEQPGYGNSYDDTVEQVLSHEDNNGDLPEKIVRFLDGVIKKMGIQGRVIIQSKNSERIIFDIESMYSGILIGKKGKTLDALQLLVNVYAGKLKDDKTPRLIVDTEDYRSRREKSLISYAQKIAHQVRRNHSSILLEAMNPFERRLIHTTLNDLKDVETISEGDGLYKKIRVQYKRY